MKIWVSTPFLLFIISRHVSGPQPSPSPLPRTLHPTKLGWQGIGQQCILIGSFPGTHHLLSVQSGDPCPSHKVPPPCLSPTPIADAMKGCRGESPFGGKGGKGDRKLHGKGGVGGDGGGGTSSCLLSLCLSQTFSGKRPNAVPPPLVFQTFSLDHHSAGPHLLLLLYWRVGGSEKQTGREGFIHTTQSKHQASPLGPHFSFAFSNSVSPCLILSCHLPLSLPQEPVSNPAGHEEHSTSPRGRECVNKLTQVGNWKGERQKQTQRFRDHADKRDQDPDCGIAKPIAMVPGASILLPSHPLHEDWDSWDANF